MRIAAAQSLSVPNDIAANVDIHCRFIAAAQAAEVDILAFPELSLSGYELSALSDCIVQPQDAALAPIRQLLEGGKTTVVLGAPLANGSALPYIGAITLFADGRTSLYYKQHLDPTETAFASEGARTAECHELAEQSFVLAICADTSHQQHAQRAAATGASLYLAGVLLSQKGYPADATRFGRYAADYRMTTLLANHGGPSGPYVSAGRSAIWAPDGALVIEAPGTGSYLVSAHGTASGWRGELLSIDD
jgi:predicted amidohydrolase